MTSQATNELRLAVQRAKEALASHVKYYGFDRNNEEQRNLESEMIAAQTKLYRETGEITLRG